MARRFTDTTKWDEKSYRKLPPPAKYLLFYIKDRCDAAGFYEIDNDAIEFQTGLNEEQVEGAIQALVRGCLGASKGILLEASDSSDWVWIAGFLEEQKNHLLNPQNNCHKSIIALISKQLERFPTIPVTLGADQGLFRPIGKGKGKGLKPKENKVRPEDMDLPDNVTRAVWFDWIRYRRDRRLTVRPQTLRKQLDMLAGESDPIGIISKSIESGWSSLWPPKNTAQLPQAHRDPNRTTDYTDGVKQPQEAMNE